MAKKLGGHTIGAVGGLKIPPVTIWIAGYRYCANKAVPGTKTIVQYSNDFGAADKCQTVAQNEIGQGAKVLFQVAGGCGIGTLKAADAAGLWGIGVDSDEYNDAKRILTSATKHTDTGVYDTVTRLPPASSRAAPTSSSTSRTTASGSGGSTRASRRPGSPR